MAPMSTGHGHSPPTTEQSHPSREARTPEQVPSVLLLARGSLDGATDPNIHALSQLREWSEARSGAASSPLGQTSPWAPYTLLWSNLSQGSKPFTRL